MREITPVVLEENEFECRDESLLVALFRIFELPWFWCKATTQGFFNRMSIYKNRIIGWCPDLKHQTCNFGVICVWKSMEIWTDRFYCSSFDNHEFATWIEMNDFSIKPYSELGSFQIQTLMRKKLYLLRKRNRVSSYVNNDGLFRKLQTIRIVAQSKKRPLFFTGVLFYKYETCDS